MPNQILLRTEQLAKRFGRIVAVNNLNLEVHQGDIYGFLGLNGAGKTTTIRMLLKLIKPSTGTIWLYGKELRRNYLEIIKSVGALIEMPVFYPYLSARQNLLLLARLSLAKSRNGLHETVSHLLGKVGLVERADDKVRTYSQGMRQRLGIAQALLPAFLSDNSNQHTPLIILDEPTNGLDPQGITDIRNLLKELNQQQRVTLLISSHLLSEIELLCNRVGIIKQGNLVIQGEVDKLLRETSALRLKAKPSNKAMALVKDLNWCTESRHGMSAEEIVVKCPFNRVSDLNTYLVQHNIQISEISPYGRTLEEYFISLM